MRPIVLTILDGWGYSKNTGGNAITNAGTVALNEILQNYPSMLLQASGPAVGMTYGESGNSEVGHMTLGAGRVIFQYLTRINKAIKNEEFFTNPVLMEAATHSKTNNSTFHIVGLLTSGAVHAHLDHLVALVKFAKDNNLQYKIHLFTDGRDSGLREASDTLQKLSNSIGGLENLATVIGRDFSMDRNNNWNKTETTYNLLTQGAGLKTENIFKELDGCYAKELHDGDIPAIVVNEGLIKPSDSIIFFNFREDSMRQIVECFTETPFDKFQRTLPENLYVAGMTRYTESPILHTVFPPPTINYCLSDVLSINKKKHLHIAETEKYAHVTFFFNGLRNAPFEGETDFFIPSLENPIEHPGMRAMDIAQKVCEELDGGVYDFYVINIANGDILAHLGNLEAATQGVRAADQAIGMIKNKVLEKDGIMIITADHGNVESMIYRGTGSQETKHNDSPIPFHLIAKEYQGARTQDQLTKSLGQASGLLSDVAPTVLDLMQIEKPAEMTGQSLLSDLL
ncbi:MAG: 2,3-bisphosphoglycerate-independent phosphoglycerate mutase [Candidatus Pacebacteria bacterium]|nr:2,3-bisphosphoglycerate-independent phosphoglycerate mutase [Candidatus Paceibacterota bacterium]